MEDKVAIVIPDAKIISEDPGYKQNLARRIIINYILFKGSNNN